MSTAVDAAIAYAERGLSVFPCGWAGAGRKLPLTKHGFKDASTDASVIRMWWKRWPAALVGTPTGREFVVLDVDPRHDGFETLARLGFKELPITMTASTAGGGVHIYFEPPVPPIRNTSGDRGRGVGVGLDWRGEGGYVILPSPLSGYKWISTEPLAPVPAALMPKEAPTSFRSPPPSPPAIECTELTRYGEAALRSAAEKIMSAPNGAQEWTLNAEALSIGRLAGAGGVPADLALDILITAGLAMVDYNPDWEWEPQQVETKVRRAFAQGLARPRPEWTDPERDEAALAEAWDAAGREATDA